MGVILITAMKIQGNGDDVKCTAYGTKEGKYSGIIELWHGKDFHEVMLSTDPPTFSSKKEAIDHMEDIVCQVRALDLDDPFGKKQANVE